MVQIENYIGNFGRYQALVYGLLFIPSALSGALTLVLAFTGAVPPTRCCIPQIDNCSGNYDGNFHSDEVWNYSNRWYYSDGNDDLQQWCSYCPQAINSTSYNCTETVSQDCDSGYVYDTSQYRSTLAMDFGMVCDFAWKRELAQSLYMVGVLVGAGVFGSLADRFGRRPVLLCCCFLQIIVFNAMPLANSYILFCILQAVGSAVQYGTYLSGYIIVMELIAGYPRTVCGIWVQGYFTVGYVYVGVMAYFIRDWKWLQWACAIPTLLYIPLYWFFPESIRWQIVNGKSEDARKTLLKVARMNKTEIPADVLDDYLQPPKTVSQKATVLDLFKHWVLAKNTLIVFFNWFVCSMVYYGLSLNTSDLPGDAYINFILSGIVELPGFIICVPLMERFGRRPALIILFGCGGVACVVSGVLPANLSAVVVTLAVIGKMCVAAAFAVIYNYSAELFPTVVRNSGTGFSSLCARIGSILAPQIHLLAIYTEKWLPIVVYGSFAVAVAALDILLPETMNRPLPETLEDGIEFAKKHRRKNSAIEEAKARAGSASLTAEKSGKIDEEPSDI